MRLSSNTWNLDHLCYKILIVSIIEILIIAVLCRNYAIKKVTTLLVFYFE